MGMRIGSDLGVSGGHGQGEVGDWTEGGRNRYQGAVEDEGDASNSPLERESMIRLEYPSKALERVN